MVQQDAADNSLHGKTLFGNNVLWKRRQQLLNWDKSDANLTTTLRRPVHHSKVQFTEADVFLSACLSGDVEEVQGLLDHGADINTCTVDGLTALHQAVIDNKPDMVQFLCDHQADLNATDNEGWTPLHAAACCSNVELVHFLCQEGADIAVTNNDKELAVDLAEEDDCRLALEQEHRSRNIDPEQCRNREMVLMKRDAEEWLRSGQYKDRPHSKSGAYALHVAAAKGYIEVMRVQLRAGADVDCTDKEGWTPLHAAAHWGCKEAISLLLSNGASLDALTNNGESVLAVADKEVLDVLNTAARNRHDSGSSQPALKRAGSVSSVLRMSTDDKLKKTKLDEQDEHRELTEGSYSFVLPKAKAVSPSVECVLPCPSHRLIDSRESEDRTSSSSRSDSTNDSWPSVNKTSPQEQSPTLASRSDSESSRSSRPEPSPPHKHMASPEEVSSRSVSTESSVGPVKEDSVKNKWTTPRSASVQCSLPWMSLYKTAQPPTHPAFSHFQTALRHTPQAPLPLAVAGSAPPTRLPTPPTEPNLPKESEAERRSKAKRQRDSRRSTQGVTREQLRAATGTVLRETSVTSQSPDSSDVCVQSKETSTVKRRSQGPRNARRGTGPICVEEVQNAMHAMTVHKDDSPTAVVQPSCSVLSPRRDPTPAVDYQLLYNNEERETDRLKRQLHDAAAAAAAQQSNVVATNGVNRVLTRTTGRIETGVGKASSIDDNERRSYERRIAELEYEVKQLQHLRTDNQKLKEENGALIRVISKLSK